MSADRELIGHIGVDSGQMLLTDPCYIDSIWEKVDELDFGEADENGHHTETGETNYNGACRASMSARQAGILGHGAMAVCSSGLGDGSYPVYVEYSDEGAWGKRIKSMTIVFIEDPYLCAGCDLAEVDNDGDYCWACEEFVCAECGRTSVDYEGDICEACQVELETDEDNE